MKSQSLCLTFVQAMLIVVVGCGPQPADSAGPETKGPSAVLQAELTTLDRDPGTVACSAHGGCRGHVLVTLPDGNQTSERGLAVRLFISLTSLPEGPVTVSATSTDPTEGLPSRAVVFQPATWWRPQTIVITGQPDAVDDGDQAYRIRFAVAAPRDAHYRHAEVPEVELVNQDDDVAGLVVALRGAPITSERGRGVTIGLSLASAPTAEVRVHLTVTDDTEAGVLPASLVFTPKHWDHPQLVRVRGRGDLLADGTVPYEVVLSVESTDATYARLPAKRLAFENLDGAAFAGIGHLEEGDTTSAAYAVNADGTVVVGVSAGESSGHAVRWSPQTGIALLGSGAGVPRAVNGSGKVIVGVAPDGAGYAAAARWVDGAGPELLPLAQQFGQQNISVEGISGDGQVIVGFATWRVGPLDAVGLVWTPGHPDGDNPSGYSVISGANQDGSVLVGYTIAGRSGGPSQAVRAGQALPMPTSSSSCSDEGCWSCMSPPRCSARAVGVSRDGGVTVGRAVENNHALMVAAAWGWAADGAATVLSSGQLAEALAVSGDGKVVVGYEDFEQTPAAMRWSEGRSDKLADLLGQAGVAVDGWTLNAARGASEDGRVIVGNGVNPAGKQEGWIAVLPP